ncbi:hypothetical protein C0995_005311 [Termitomyces sp. Mi166|nr:hypothetical protein C0995_005311 [Termitomyces sp. Mi166\
MVFSTSVRRALTWLSIFCFFGAQASPLTDTQPSVLITRDNVTTFTTLSQTEISAFRPFSYYAATAYCTSSETANWNCGANCKANRAFEPIAAGGDGDDVQYWFVGIDPKLKTIVVSHQGTDPFKLLPLLTDGDILLSQLDPTLFPGVDDSVMVHGGFRDSQAETSADILAAVKTAMAQSGLNDVTVVGHSLGAAIALLDGLFLPLHIPGVNVKVIGYGMPRVGNDAFADFVDGNLDLTRITHKNDVIPIVPGRFLGFHHPSGEKHIQHDDVTWIACPGNFS